MQRTDLTGWTVLVTGASRGIGRAIAFEFASQGTNLVLVARSVGPLSEAANEARQRGAASVFSEAGDVGDPDFCRRLVRSTEECGRPVDILVNNAGVGVFRPLPETRPEELEAPLRVPLLAALALSHACLPGMQARGRGTIVNMTSAGGRIAIPNSAAYAASRFGMSGFTQALQAELRGTPIRAILVCPGEVATDYFTMNRSSPDDLPRSRRLFRTLTPEEVAKATVRAVRTGRELVIIPFSMGLFIRFYQAFPPLGKWLLRALEPRR